MSDNSFAGINFNDPESKSIFDYHSENMCPQFKNVNDAMFIFNLNIKKTNNNAYMINGDIDGKIGQMSNFEKLYVKYSAPNPPTYNSNFSGSGLPYPTEEIAFENTPNKGVAEIVNGKFSFTIRYPNSYYINMGSVYVGPHVKLLIVDKDNRELSPVENIKLGEGIPFRTLTWPVQRNWNAGSLFYENRNLPVRTQYQILLDSAYPSVNKVPKNFWGTMPPH
jgi:hypothetical protein